MCYLICSPVNPEQGQSLTLVLRFEWIVLNLDARKSVKEGDAKEMSTYMFPREILLQLYEEALVGFSTFLVAQENLCCRSRQEKQCFYEPWERRLELFDESVQAESLHWGDLERT